MAVVTDLHPSHGAVQGLPGAVSGTSNMMSRIEQHKLDRRVDAVQYLLNECLTHLERLR